MDQGKARPTPPKVDRVEKEELLTRTRALIKDPKAREAFSLSDGEAAEALAHGF